MSNAEHPDAAPSLEMLDRLAVAYLTLPLLIFVIGWMVSWAAIAMVVCILFSLRGLLATRPRGSGIPITRLQIGVALLVGFGWTALGGTGHLVFANTDWHIRDAVLHDLVASPWPVGYGTLDGKQSILRAPLAYYMPAALIGKWAGLHAAHLAMALWTAMGTSLFLIQVLTLVPSRKSVIALAMLVIVFFSGLDIVGSVLNDGPDFRRYWSIAKHLEWWAGLYQYSSMTTQLFWVPNHALGGWLTIGLLARARRSTADTALDSYLPIVLVAVAFWSPFAAIGVLPFVLWKLMAGAVRGHEFVVIRPRVWAPALVVAAATAGYLGLDASRIPHSWQISRHSLVMDLLDQAQFVLLEAGLIGIAILAIQRSSEVVLALIILALLPMINFGPGNDFVMRASIPSLAVLAIAACVALSKETSDARARRWKWALGGLLLVGAVTAMTEMARTYVLPAWPINLEATLIGAACDKYPSHYVAHLGEEPVVHLLRPPNPLALGPIGRQSCNNPALYLMWRAGLQRL